MSGFGAVPALQKVFQARTAYIHKMGSADTLTSTIIPAGLSLVAAACLGKGLFSLYTGIGKLD